MKKILLLLSITLFFSCEKDELSDSKTVETATISNTDAQINGNEITSQARVDFQEFDLATLSSSCDLSTYNFTNFTVPVQWFGGGAFDTSSIGLGEANTYGEFPSLYLSKSLTWIFLNTNSFLKMSLAPSTNNPKTGQPYFRTVIGRNYDVYRFNDSGVPNHVSGGRDYNFINGSVTSSNELKKIIACKILQIANQVDPTAFIVDLGIDTDTNLALGTAPRYATVYIKWGYHQ